MLNPPNSEWALVSVIWQDAFDGDNGWVDIDDYEPNETLVVNVGWLVPNVLDGYVTLVSGFILDMTNVTSGVCHIPVGMIRKTIVLNACITPVEPL